MTRPISVRGTWAAYAAVTWAVLFAALSVYWGTGGTAGLGTLAQSIQDSAREHDSVFILEVWVTALLKLIAGLVALAQIRSWGARIPAWIRRVGIWGTGIVLFLYGSSNLVQDILIETGVVAVPQSMGAFRGGLVPLLVGTLVDARWRSLSYHALDDPAAASIQRLSNLPKRTCEVSCNRRVLIKRPSSPPLLLNLGEGGAAAPDEGCRAMTSSAARSWR